MYKSPIPTPKTTAPPSSQPKWLFVQLTVDFGRKWSFFMGASEPGPVGPLTRQVASLPCCFILFGVSAVFGAANRWGDHSATGWRQALPPSNIHQLGSVKLLDHPFLQHLPTAWGFTSLFFWGVTLTNYKVANSFNQETRLPRFAQQRPELKMYVTRGTFPSGHSWFGG